MSYKFSEEKFIENFNAKNIETKSVDSIRITHRANNRFRLFPYKASTKLQSPVITELRDVVSTFFKEVLNKKTTPIKYDVLCSNIREKTGLEIDEEDLDYFRDIIRALFFVEDNFITDNIALYPYQSASSNKSVENLAHFLLSVFGMNRQDCTKVESAIKKNKYNVLDEMIKGAIESKEQADIDEHASYFLIKTNIQNRFKKDFYFMINNGMTSMEDFSNLFAIYYFYYVSQTCVVLDKFCTCKRDEDLELYYALDWEKVNKNRCCCTKGWSSLQNNINHMFSHAITLEILNQTCEDNMYDYITLGEMAEVSSEMDTAIANEIVKAETIYCSYVGDYRNFEEIVLKPSSSKTEGAIIHLYKCVESQFLMTERKRAHQLYNEKFLDFCKSRWVKNRRKSGLVLNLRESDIIFLTKIALQDNEKMRLNDLFKEYEKRGIYLDGTSKEYLQEYFSRLNLIDKKSDSGDAQYVKRIL